MARVWSVADIADALEAGLRAACAALDTEQSVYGLDSLDEVALHPVIARSLQRAGYGVFREQRYPADRHKHRESVGERCDFVLTPDGRPLAERGAKATLFEPADAVEPDEAFWMEAKIVAQFTPEGPNRTYASQLLSGVRPDVTKLSKDSGILHSGLLVMIWASDSRVAEHDFGVWQQRCLARGLPIAVPSRRVFPINDRHGNGVCAIAVFPVSHL